MSAQAEPAGASGPAAAVAGTAGSAGPEVVGGPAVGTRRRVRSFSLVAGGLIVALIIVTALVALIWTPYPALAVDPAGRLAGSSGAHLLGTDQYGRDVLSRLMSGARITLYTGFISVLVATAVGIPAGLVAALYGGVVGQAVLRLTDILYGFPALLAAIALSAALGASTTTAMIAIGVAYIPVFVRVTRANALGVLASEYVMAARAYGRRPWAIVRRHVLPNIATTIVVQMCLLFSLAILAEAALDYLGLGTRPPAPSWGSMLQQAQGYLHSDPALSLWPGLAVFVVVLGFSLLGDGLAELFDVRARR
ncbi:ABC transporter permease [Acidiferrimicrobium sp. IK]|uniref:ABC transporter permease n=1 Tax=Acidiferrimicrobium sp. IK TaxID=2871700 RepID=UPI0021CB466E|nr:ABC transporter permease [Acidiferrimicrobium sp. IK]MCU4184951.1 ABC transporter permease [Acidiferrimicrobium sp. IK]